MGPIRNLFKNDHYLLSININNSERSKQELNRTKSTNNEKRSTSRTQNTNSDKPIKTDEENSDNDDCLIKFGFVSSSEEKNNRLIDRNQKEKTSKTQIEEDENEQNISDRPANFVEEITTITALIIYDTYSKKHEFTLSSQHRAKKTNPPNSIRDDIDRFDAIYSCLIDQSNKKTTSSRNRTQAKKYNLLNNYLRDRFFTLSDINELKIFQQNEQSRIFQEKKATINRVPFIPNILSYQRTCPDYNLDEIKWIRDHLC